MLAENNHVEIKADLLAFRASPAEVALVELRAACRGISKTQVLREAVAQSLRPCTVGTEKEPSHAV